MKPLNHWFVCLDLTRMDHILAGYVRFLSTLIEPKTITFFHVIESGGEPDELAQFFPQMESTEELEDVVREELSELVEEQFQDSDIETRIVLKNGHPTDEIVQVVKAMNPDLMILGKKKGYEGEGLIARRIVKYVPNSILFVPETARYSISTIHSPVDFSERSAEALQFAGILADTCGAELRAEHIYRYPSHYFPYMPSKSEKKQLLNHVQEKKASFTDKYELPEDLTFDLTLHQEKRIMDTLYDGTVRHQADLIVAGAKGSKKISSLVRDDFIDKMSFYHFGIPLLILKNKEKHSKFFKTLLDS